MFEWAHPYAGWIYVSAAVALLLLVALARRLAISDRLRSWLLFIPRLAVFALLLVVLLNPVRKTELRLPDQPAQVYCLVDGSRSMALEQPESRALAVQRVLQSLNQGSSPKSPRLQLFRFGEQLSSVSDISQLVPRDDASRLTMALEQVPSRFTREPPRCAVVFSDGAIDDADRLSAVAEGFQALKIPVHVYPVGSPLVRGDVALEELVIPPRIEPGSKVPVRGVIRATGYEGERVVVQVVSADRPQLPPLAVLPLTLSGQPQQFEMVVEANPEYGRLVLESPPLSGEVTDQNNRVSFQLASAPRKLRVIYMEGTGGDEYRWVRDALQEDPDIECVSMVADQQYVQRPRLVRLGDVQRGFPATRAELMQFDCVICSDISLGAFTREQLEWTVELVSERGGGFAMVGGHTSFGAGGWDQTAWDQLIPVDMTGGALGRGWVYHTFGIEVPEEARKHPIWQIVDDPAENRQALATIPSFLGTNYMQRLKPAATVLAVSNGPIPNAGIMPIFASQSYGRGRTFAFAPDTTADWGRLFESQWGVGDNRYFRRFWRNVVRWLSENSMAGIERLKASTDRPLYRAGQPIAITATAFDAQLRPTLDYQLTAEIKTTGATASPAPIPLEPSASNREYGVQIESRTLMGSGEGTDGSLVLIKRTVDVVASHKGKELARVSVPVQILPDTHELLQPRPQPENLALLAESSGGRVLRNVSELRSVLDQLPVTRGESLISKQPLWDNWLVWLTILVLLAIEWSLRRRAGFA